MSIPSFQTDRRPPRVPRPARLRRRRRLLWISALPALLALLLGTHLATLGSDFERGARHYEAGRWWQAEEAFFGMRSPNLVERWKAHFNTGTAAYRNESYGRAVTTLEAALEHVPDQHRCDVQTNLSLVYAAWGDRFAERAADALEWAIAQAEAEIAREQGEPFDADLFELNYKDEEITSADRFEEADWLQYAAADYYAAGAAALADPLCAQPPPPGANAEEQERAAQEQEQREAERERLEDQALEAEQARQDIERAAQGEEPQQAQPDDDEGDGDGDDSGTDESPGPPQQGEDEQSDGAGRETPEERAAREEAERQAQLDARNDLGKERAEGGDGGQGADGGTDGEGPGGTGPPRSNW